MRTILLNLAWKEWHEHKWKVAALVATLWGVTALMLLTLDRRESFEGPLLALRVVLAMCVVPLAIFIGLSTAAGERSRGTLPFMQALPVPMWRVALNKVFFGLATLTGAALLTLLFVYVWCKIHAPASTSFQTAARPGEDPFSFGIRNWFGDSALAILCIAFSFYIWTIACGVNKKDEVMLAPLRSWSWCFGQRWFPTRYIGTSALRGQALPSEVCRRDWQWWPNQQLPAG